VPSELGLFSFISLNSRGRSLTDIRTIVELIAATKTKTGLTVQRGCDPNWYPTAVKISDRDHAATPLRPHD
jgi:Rhodopirellula transposase DDE domain